MEVDVEERPVARCLVVEDDAGLSIAIARVISCRVQSTRIATTVEQAREQLMTWRPNLVMLDVKLLDGTAVDLLEGVAELMPWPTFIAMSGRAGVKETFRLAQLGVRAFLPKPLDIGQLLDTVDRVLSVPPEWTPVVKNMVGHGQLMSFEEDVRRIMIDEALNRTNGSRRAAAKVLSITRQALQHMIRRRA
jgi:DNA-binding NtrC family response regulator